MVQYFPMCSTWNVAKPSKKSHRDAFPEIDPIAVQLLYNRGITEQKDIDDFFNPNYGTDLHDPFLFVNMEKAAELILLGIRDGKKIVVYGDYDADGVSATATMVGGLRALGAHPEVYIPFRETEGYGLNADAVQDMIENGTQLVITVDCGISNYAEVEQLISAGVVVVVTDHHQQPLKLPNASAIVNPNTDREAYPFKSLSGSGVAFKVVQALAARDQLYGMEKLEDGWEKWLLDLVAIGTIADLMPLLGENRTLVSYGLIVLGKTKRLGLRKLIEKAGNGVGEITEKTVGFTIAPRLNAAGRLEHASTAYQLLVTDNQAEAEVLAESINQTNQQRQQLTEQNTREARQQIANQKDEGLLVAIGDGWPTGILGLVAGRLADKCNKPTLVISHFAGELIGSGRSVEPFNITKALQQCDQFLLRYGGHAQAAGFTLKNDSQLAPFIQKLRTLTIAAKTNQLAKSIQLDAELTIADITWDFFDLLEKFRPYGQGNPRPAFALYGVIIVQASAVGQEQKHLRLKLTDNQAQTLSGIAFGFGSLASKLKPGTVVDIATTIDCNEWNGNRELQLNIIDIATND